MIDYYSLFKNWLYFLFSNIHQITQKYYKNNTEFKDSILIKIKENIMDLKTNNNSW